MKMTNTKTIFEFGYLAVQESLETTVISKSAFNYLKDISLQEGADTNKCLKLVKRYGIEMLQVQNYVGVLFAPNGEHIEVLPKIAKKTTNIKTSRKQLLMMLQSLGTFRHIVTNQASVESKNMSLLDIFIDQFLSSVSHLIKCGLRSDYISQTDNLNYCKGKLLISKQLKHNFINQHKFYVEYDEYMINRPANRLLKTALRKVQKYAQLAKHQRLLHELLFMFADVPVSKSVKQDINALKIGRNMSEYNTPLAWAKLILAGVSPLSMQGNNQAFSLLFPMESVFESYVASVLRKQLINNATLTVQAKEHYLIESAPKKFKLKPDLLINLNDNNQTQIVLDTKWKLIEPNSSKDHLSQSDFYQMFAYGHKYLNGEGDLILIYPAHDEFMHAVEHSYKFNNGLNLWVCPFLICDKGKSELLLPDNLQLEFINFRQKSKKDVRINIANFQVY